MARARLSTAVRHAPVVALGGAAGAVLRFLIDRAITVPGSVPWEVLLINVVGSAALGWLAARASGHPAWVYPAVGTGLLGGFTTFSAVAALPWTDGLDIGRTAVVLGATAVVAQLAAWAGWEAATRAGAGQGADAGDGAATAVTEAQP